MWDFMSRIYADAITSLHANVHGMSALFLAEPHMTQGYN
jgi:hypothetical protein